ncbi:response regulator [Sulfurospirillum barnesii]|uniref:Response regulator with CheY-like receiver, AAA-type ATPase, and DNA-binding domains n=1 Tax=Sulfurospirillum barnesii (strain ATCC 700032 / DSM 10660 / SES-3) TaxID=760154 RepID=I3XYP4_SULBS|nr:response regulator [Sulfurospirillum barnesii]AFL69068.1 response regulator with CheY-like receiver, AAA-type ATPase, and DNA-binding domains [Sulfurospirillum barnesii SES-3]
MKILIVENEIYLAQSIASKLMEIGHLCEISTSIKDALKDEKYDAVLLSTNISGQNFYPVIEKHRNSIIILMISYISNDTVTNPIKAGACDYIQKPFMIEELMRKLRHLNDFKNLKKENETYKEYVTNLFASAQLEPIDKKTKFPLLIKTNFQKHADALVFHYAQMSNETFTFISLTQGNAFEKITRANNDELLYVIDLQNLKRSEKIKAYTVLEGKRAIICSTDPNEESTFSVLEINTESKVLDQGDVLSIDEYVKYVIYHFQNKFPDTELSKKLGISRKSLWEKRKKYGINKKK